MISTPERIAASKANALKSTGPKTEAGKEASRANSYKHGLTGEGIVMAQDEAHQVAELARRMRAEMKPVTEIGGILLDRIAMLSVRLKRCEAEELIRIAAMNDGEGGLVDLSREGQFAFRYEQAAQRDFHKSHAEFRRVEAEAKANGVVATLPVPNVSAPVASFSPATAPATLRSPIDPPPFEPLLAKAPKPPMFFPAVTPISASPPLKRPG